MIASPRQPAHDPEDDTLTVYLFQREAVVAIGEARALGVHGMVIEPLPGLVQELPAGLRLELGVGVETDGITRRYRIPARVVRQEEDAVGLAFDAEDAALVEIVRRALARRLAAR